MSLSRMEAFFQGYNPYTGAQLPEASRSANEAQSTWNTYSASNPIDTQVNPNEVLDPLYQAQNELSKARNGINQIRQFWSSVQREATSATTQVDRANADLYPAQNDNPETDNSRTGQYVSNSLDQIERQLYNLRYSGSNSNSILYEIKSQLATAQSYLNQVEARRLPNPYRLSESVSSLGQFQSQVYRIEMAQQQLDNKLQALQTPINSARYDLNTVSGDSEGTCISQPARSASNHLNCLSKQLQQIEQHIRYGDSDLNLAETSSSAAEQSVQLAYQDYQSNWRTSDHRS